MVLIDNIIDQLVQGRQGPVASVTFALRSAAKANLTKSSIGSCPDSQAGRFPRQFGRNISRRIAGLIVPKSRKLREKMTRTAQSLDADETESETKLAIQHGRFNTLFNPPCQRRTTLILLLLLQALLLLRGRRFLHMGPTPRRWRLFWLYGDSAPHPRFFTSGAPHPNQRHGCGDCTEPGDKA